jgi:hypothetical protein
VLLILAALGLAIFGVVRLGRALPPGQRIVLVLVFILGVVWLVFSLINAGVLGRPRGRDGSLHAPTFGLPLGLV